MRSSVDSVTVHQGCMKEKLRRVCADEVRRASVTTETLSVNRGRTWGDYRLHKSSWFMTECDAERERGEITTQQINSSRV